MQLLGKTQINFVGMTKYAFIFSILLIIVGIVSIVMRGDDNLSIDFRGGTVLQVHIEPLPTVEAVRSVLSEHGFDGVRVQTVKSPDTPEEILITFPSVGMAGTDVAEAMKAALREGLVDSKVEERRQESVGAKIGGELKTGAINSVMAALVLIVLYITIRFVFRYGIAAIVALVHDVVITLGVFSLIGHEISLSIIAAFLTIIGYSLNDTIVVFDRIRENMRLRRKESYREVINRSINETLSRTLVTSLTTLFVAGTLFVLGGPVIHDFAFALCFGVFIGTYSSIFIASPVLVWWHERHMADAVRQRQAL
jgi:preprotein translocase SecF subunit